jgi:replication-associated recombination protein RarA
VIANTTKSHFETLSAVLAGKAELREVIEKALERRRLYNLRTVLFVKDVRESLIELDTSIFLYPLEHSTPDPLPQNA